MNYKKKIYIHGSFMNDNYGDFLLYYMIHSICESYKDKYEFFSADIDSSYDKYCNINRKKKKDGVFNSDLVIFAGGGYFGEPDKRKFFWNIRCLIKHIIPAYIVSKRQIPYIIVGIETGPMLFKINKILLRKIFNKAKYVSVRNRESKEFLKKIKVENEIAVNPDWVMGIDEKTLIEQDNGRVDELFEKANKDMKKIFVHLTTRNSYGIENVINDLIVFSKSREDILFIVGCDQKRKRQEKRAIDLCSKLPGNRCLLAFYEGPWILSTLLSKSDAIITDKLHVGIVATKLHKEVISVACHNKTIKFYNLIGRKEWTNHVNEIKPNETLLKLKKLHFRNIEINGELFIKAKNNEKIVRKFLEDN